MARTNTLPTYDSSRLRHPVFEELIEAVRYRYLVLQVVRRDLLSRYKRSVLGVAWSMLNPLGMMIVMTIVFSTIFGRDPGYRAYLLSGLLSWNFFADVTNSINRNMIWGSSLLKRIYVPRTAFAIASVGSGLVNLLLAFVPLLLVMQIYNVKITWALLYVPFPTILIMFFSLGLGLILSVATMYFADVAEIYKVGLRAWMYLTPIIYPESLLKNNGYGWLLDINPMRHLIRMFRLPIQDGRIPTWEETWPGLLIGVVTLLVGWYIFTKYSDEFAYRV
jgi:ABC-2 type transport system permease protein